MNRKFFAFDIDGTLLDSNKQPLDSTLKALDLLRDAGHCVTVATGRSRFHAQDIIRSLSFDNYILCNGQPPFFRISRCIKICSMKRNWLLQVAEAQELGIDTAFVGMDTAKRASSLDIAKMEAAMHSFWCPTLSWTWTFLKKKKSIKHWLFTEKSMSISLTRNTANCFSTLA